jgi:nitrilase
VDLLLLPELATIDYSRPSFEKLPWLAEPLLGSSFERFSAMARRQNCAVSYGFPRTDGSNTFISQIVIDQSGDYLTHYDKIHLAQFGAAIEQEFFSPGDHLSVFTLGEFRLGLIICYDMRFPELSRLIVDRHDLDVILHPVAFTRDGTFESWPHFVIARAIENQVYFVSLNRAGEGWGGSIFCPPWVDANSKPAVMGEEEAWYIFSLDKQLLSSVRESYQFRGDRLESYSRLPTGRPV